MQEGIRGNKEKPGSLEAARPIMQETSYLTLAPTT